ncbi:MAG: GntR family transcriptional regulator [Acetivibrionales bacterium]
MINKYSNVPLYSQLKNLIIEKIAKGEFAEESKIPSEQELCEMYDISRPTVRQAISELTNSGVLYKQKGKGTFVSKSKTAIDVKNYSGFTDSILDSMNPGQHNIISINKVDNTRCVRLDNVFKLKTDFAEVKYLSMKDNSILALNVSFIPLNLFPDIIQAIKEKKPSYDIMKGRYPLLPVRTKCSLDVVYTDQSDAQYIQVKTGQPLIRIENILYSKSGQVVEYVISKYRADNCILKFENSK